MPIEVAGSPFSTLDKVGRVIPARSAINDMDILRRARASLMSCPSFLRALFAGIGMMFVLRILSFTLNIFSVKDNLHIVKFDEVLNLKIKKKSLNMTCIVG